MTAAEVKRILDAQCGPETARRIGDAFAASERERELLERTVAALTEPERHRPTTIERDAAALLGSYFALRRIYRDYGRAGSGDTMAQDRVRLLEANCGGMFLHMVRNGDLHDVLRLAELLERAAHS